MAEVIQRFSESTTKFSTQLREIRSITSNAVDLVRKRNKGYKGNEDSCITCITIGATKGPVQSQSQQKQIMTIVIPADVVTIEDWEEPYDDTAVCCDIITIYNREWKEELLEQQHQKLNKQNFLVPHYLFPHGDHRNFDVTETTITFKNDILKFIFEEEEKPNNSPQCFSWKLFLNDREDEVTSYRSNETEMKALACDNTEFTEALEKYRVMSAYPLPTLPGRGSSSSNWRAKDEPLTQSRPVTASNPESADTILVTVNLTRNKASNDPSIKATIIVSLGENSIVTDADAGADENPIDGNPIDGNPINGNLIDVKYRCEEFSEKHGGREWYVCSFETNDGTTDLANCIRDVWATREEFSLIEPHLLYCGSSTSALRNYGHQFPPSSDGTVSFIGLEGELRLEPQTCHINVHSHLRRDKALHDSRSACNKTYDEHFKYIRLNAEKFLDLYYNPKRPEYETFTDWLAAEEAAVAFKYPIIRMGFSVNRRQVHQRNNNCYNKVYYYTNENGATSHHKYLHNPDGARNWGLEDFDLDYYRGFIVALKTEGNSHF